MATEGTVGGGAFRLIIPDQHEVLLKKDSFGKLGFDTHQELLGKTKNKKIINCKTHGMWKSVLLQMFHIKTM